MPGILRLSLIWCLLVTQVLQPRYVKDKQGHYTLHYLMSPNTFSCNRRHGYERILSPPREVKGGEVCKVEYRP